MTRRRGAFAVLLWCGMLVPHAGSAQGPPANALTFPRYFPLVANAQLTFRDTYPRQPAETGRIDVGVPERIDGIPEWVVPFRYHEAITGTYAFSVFYSSDSTRGFTDYGTDDRFCSIRYDPPFTYPSGLTTGALHAQTVRHVVTDRNRGDGVDCEASGAVRREVTLVGFESVTVPAGTFDNVARVRSVDTVGTRIVDVVTIYLAPRVGIIKMVGEDVQDGFVREIIATSIPYTITFAAFIPANNVQFTLGHPICAPVWVKGDDRGFDAFGRTFRVLQTVTVMPERSRDADGLLDGTIPRNLISESKHFARDALDLNGRLRTDIPDDDPPNDCRLLHTRSPNSNANMRVNDFVSDWSCLVAAIGTDYRLSNYSVGVRFCGSATDDALPLLYRCAIDWDLRIELDVSGPRPIVSVQGAHDGFPAYEIWVNDEPAYQRPAPMEPNFWEGALGLCGSGVRVDRPRCELGNCRFD